jgi:phenylpropionate dioxygenase-like ring-hydroxylating dioxygenase large terminal subunit
MTRKYLGGLVDVERGSIGREVFSDAGIYNEERERVFGRSWLFVGHETQIPRNGDFFLSYMGEDSVILNRDSRGTIHVFLNSCRHRGMRVCRYDFGTSKVFTCPYHGWGYGNDGKLLAVPEYENGYAGRMERADWGLAEVPHLTNYRGTIWATWDAEAAPFEAYMGDALQFLDAFLELPDGSHGELEAIGGVQKWTFPSNWKWAAENFIGDFYHGISHVSVDKVRISPTKEEGRHTNDVVKHPAHTLNLSLPDSGHGARAKLMKGDFPYTPQYADDPVVEEYFREAYAKRQERLGIRARAHWSGGNIFPNMSFSNGRTSIAVWHPRGADKTEAWRWYLVPKAAPKEVKDLLRHYVIRYQGPTGMTEQDDIENWHYAHQSTHSPIAKRFPFNYKLGDGAPFNVDWANWLAPTGVVSEGITEHNQRGFYRRWAELMDQPTHR